MTTQRTIEAEAIQDDVDYLSVAIHSLHSQMPFDDNVWYPPGLDSMAGLVRCRAPDRLDSLIHAAEVLGLDSTPIIKTRNGLLHIVEDENVDIMERIWRAEKLLWTDYKAGLESFLDRIPVRARMAQAQPKERHTRVDVLRMARECIRDKHEDKWPGHNKLANEIGVLQGTLSKHIDGSLDTLSKEDRSTVAYLKARRAEARGGSRVVQMSDAITERLTQDDRLGSA